MSNLAKKEYIIEIRQRYFLITKSENSLILNEHCTVYSFNRKYAIKCFFNLYPNVMKQDLLSSLLTNPLKNGEKSLMMML